MNPRSQATTEESGTDTPKTPDQDQVSELRQMLDGKPVRRERLSRRRLTAARLMAQVQAEAVMTTTYNEVDMYEVIRIRREFGESFHRESRRETRFHVVLREGRVDRFEVVPNIERRVGRR